MAAPQPSDRVYFPPLEDCLQKTSILLSWKHVAGAFSDSSTARLRSDALREFLADGYVLGLYKTPSKLFEPATPQSRTDFQTKTAPINVTPTPNQQYDIKTIKEDSEWLSRTAGVSEVAALRVVVIEYQSRPQQHLKGPLSSQDAANIQKAAGTTNGQATGALAQIKGLFRTDAEALWAEFEEEKSRRQRILQVYLSERRYFMMSVDSITSFLLHEDKHCADADCVNIELRQSMLKTSYGVDSLDIHLFFPLLSTYLELLPGCIRRSEAGAEANLKESAESISDELQDEWVRTSLAEATHAMTLVYQILDLSRDEFMSPLIATRWFQFMSDFMFLDGPLSENELISELLLPMKGLACVISLAILNVNRSIGYLNHDIELGEKEDPYLNNSDILDTMNTATLNAADVGSTTVSIVAFAWALILDLLSVRYDQRIERRDDAQLQRAKIGYEPENRPHTALTRRGSAGSIVSLETAGYDRFVQDILRPSQQPQQHNLPSQLGKFATGGGRVYDLITDIASCAGSGRDAAFRPLIGARIRMALLDFLIFSFDLVGYQSEPVTALLAVLFGGPEGQVAYDEPSVGAAESLATYALEHPGFLNSYLQQASARYPSEFIPFVSLCRILSTAVNSEQSDLVTKLLFQTPSLTFSLPPGYDSYIDHDVSPDEFRTLEDIPLFSTRSGRSRFRAEESVCIPAGSSGRAFGIASLVQMHFEHSTIALLGRRLDLLLDAESSMWTPLLGQLEPDEAAEAIRLLAALIRTETNKASSKPESDDASDAGLAILQEASKDLPHTKDIITVICDIMDMFLQDNAGLPEELVLIILSACTEFLQTVLAVCPGRVWSYMSRCKLLSGNNRGSRVSRLTGTTDMLAERFDFLTGSMRLFSSLVDSAWVGTVQRKVGTKFPGSRKSFESQWLGVSDKILSQVTLSISKTAIFVLETTPAWKFSSELHRSSMAGDAVVVLNNTLTHAFSLEAGGTGPSLATCFQSAGKHIVESFVSPSSSTLLFQPLLGALVLTLHVPDSSLYSSRTAAISLTSTTILDFTALLLRSASYIEYPSTAFEDQLFKSSTILARLCAASDAYTLPTISLLGSLVSNAASGTNEPPSLLGYLGTQISRSFIQVLTIFDRPFNRTLRIVGMWKFFSTVITNRQQWMANCLLTGKEPRDALKGIGADHSADPKSVLGLATVSLRSISSTPSKEALASLAFLTSAQNYWPWTVFVVNKDARLLTSLRTYVRELRPSSDMVKSEPELACDQARIAAYVAELLAMQLFHLRHLGPKQCEGLAQELVKDLDYFLRDGVEVSGYNNSLHANFQKNISKRYPGCSLDDFKRSSVVSQTLGEQYYYSLDSAETMLSFDSAWSGTRGDGFRLEMQKANLNLSLVDAQIVLFHTWEILLLEIGVCLMPNNAPVKLHMLQVAEQCLEANQNIQGPERIFADIAQQRADLALMLVQRLADYSLLPKGSSKLLITLWTTISPIEDPFGAGQIQYYRVLLKMLYMVLRGSQTSVAPQDGDDKDVSSSFAQTVLNIIDKVVARGFRTLVTLIHESDAALYTDDVALITALLQACLAIPGVAQSQTQVHNIMASHDAFHVATSLFSWGDRLVVQGDPVYGELSLLFLLELTKLPALTEQMACEGLLGHIMSANVITHMKRQNISPFADSVSAQRCYSIWVKAILPLLLNVLIALGATVAPEIAFILKQFPALLEASTQRFEAPGVSRTATRDSQQCLALLAVSEVHSLALLTRVLSGLRLNNARDISDVPWDATQLLENVEFWLSRPKLLRERLLPLGQREAEWRNAPPVKAGGDAENKLEEKVMALMGAVRMVLTEGIDEE